MKISYNRITVGLAILFLMAATSMAGCQQAPDKETQQNPGSTFPMTVTDDIGRQVLLVGQPQRIVSLAPSNTEILFGLGLGEFIVGDTTHCDYPAAAQALTKVGGYMDPSLEKIIVLKPDLIVATDVHQPLLNSLEETGLKVVVIKNPNSLAEVFASIRLIGQAAGAEQQAAEAVKSLQARLEAVNQKISSVPVQDRPTVYYEMWDDPYMSVGRDNLIAELIRSAGGTNITDDCSESYPQISSEIIIARSPQVMINSYGHDNKLVAPEDISARAGWQGIAFVRNSRIYTIDSDLLTLPGPRIIDGLEQLAVSLHPDLFPKSN